MQGELVLKVALAHMEPNVTPIKIPHADMPKSIVSSTTTRLLKGAGERYTGHTEPYIPDILHEI